MSKRPKIALKGVRKAFGANLVLDGIDLAVDEAQSLVVIGGSGSGKSVMLKCILGLMKPDAGEIYVDGTDMVTAGANARREVIKKFGMLFQGGALFDSLPVWENVGFGLIRAHGMARDEAREVAIENLRRVGLRKATADLFPAELSGGMQKRVALARAIATKPEIIFFDEPTTGLDPIMADVINHLITECVRDLGATTITITHDMSSVRKIANRAALLYRGKIVWQGPRDELDHSGNAYVDQFIHGRADGPMTSDTEADEEHHRTEKAGT